MTRQDHATGAETLSVIEIGGTAVKFGLAHGGVPHGFSKTCPTARIRCSDPVGALADLAREAWRACGLSPSRAVVTVPGFIGPDFDLVLHAANVPELDGLKLASDLSRRLEVEVMLERDVALQLLGERRAGAVLGENHVLAVYFGTGIGAAYWAEDAIFRGGGWALEMGHMPVHGLGRALPGLRRDRLEVYASGRSLSAIADRLGVEVGGLFTLAKADASLRAELDSFVRDQAFAVASGIAMMSPRVVLLGGGVVDMGDYPREGLRSILADHLPLPPDILPLDLRWASLGWKAAIWGAIGLADGSSPRHWARPPA